MSAGTPGFVEVTVDATGETQMVPEHYLADARLSTGLTVVESGPVEPPSAPQSQSEVQLVLGEVREGSHIPAVRDAVVAHEAVVEEAVEADPPTERSTHEEIDAYAATHGIDLGEAKTKAEKVAVIEADPGDDSGDEVDDPDTTTDTDDTESSDETPANGDEEN